MTSKSQNQGIWMGFDILAGRGPLPRPEKIKFWEPSQYKSHPPEIPFHYAADALVGLSVLHLNKKLLQPFAHAPARESFPMEAWKALEPHQELYVRSQPRIRALREALTPQEPAPSAEFERRFSGILQGCLEPWGFHLGRLFDLIDAIEDLEEHEERPLLYNFRMRLGRDTLTRLHYLHSMLFNLRALLAMDYNAHVQDPTHEAAKIDSISDYLPKAEYVANDALLYWSFRRIKDDMPAKVRDQMEEAFFTYSSNGSTLIENLPKSFLKKLSNQELEETLYLVQMDWLLGTDAGLLFRVREELYGLFEGYEKVFYPELEGKKLALQGPLSLNCQITTQTLYPRHEAA